MQSLAHKAYGNVQQRTANPREIEYALFEQITGELSQAYQAEQNGESTNSTEAISRNLQLWTILASDLMVEDNGLPLELRKGLLQLSEFVRKTSLELFSGKGSLESLIEINTIIMEGLAAAIPTSSAA